MFGEGAVIRVLTACVVRESSLSSVTRIDDQLILARLLHNESASLLRTRGSASHHDAQSASHW